MSKSSYAPFYDLFKLIVAIILLLIFLFLSRIAPSRAPQSISSISTPTPLPPTKTITSTPTVKSSTQTSIPPTVTPAPTNTPLPTSTQTPERTTTPEATESPATETSPTPTPIAENPSEPGEVCAKLAPPQLQVGMKAIIQRRLNFRSSPGIKDNWILTNSVGTQVEVVGGPTCTRYEDGIAYLWWQIKLPNGQVGWSAEASAHGYLYFMEPVR